MEAELANALRAYDRANQLDDRAAISQEEVDLYRGKALVIVARLEGLEDDIRDELARREIELRRKEAELQRAEALEKAAAAPVARNQRLNKRKPDMVSEEDVAKAEAEQAVARPGSASPRPT